MSIPSPQGKHQEPAGRRFFQGNVRQGDITPEGGSKSDPQDQVNPQVIPWPCPPAPVLCVPIMAPDNGSREAPKRDDPARHKDKVLPL